jgi:coniferyl-aldehyde dehydrogenase
MDLNTILQQQRAAFQAELPVSVEVRRDRLTRAIRMLVENAEAFCTALSDDFGHRSREQSMLTDIIASIRTLKHARKQVARWAKPERRPLQFPLGLLGAKAEVQYQPKGVVGVIAPWNFPVNLAMGPLAGIFAAGNRAMVKTSEFTPKTAALFEEVVGRYFDPAELVFVSGGPEVGREFSALPFDHLIFTGATAIGGTSCTPPDRRQSDAGHPGAWRQVADHHRPLRRHRPGDGAGRDRQDAQRRPNLPRARLPAGA